jgi:site-specific recombinase XerD
MNVQEAIDKFCKHIKANRAETTARAYINSMRHFRAYLESIDIKPEDSPTLLNADIFVEYPEYLKLYTFNGKTGKAGLAKKSLGVYISAAKNLFDWLIIKKLIDPPDYAESLRFNMAIKEAMKTREQKLVRFPKLEEADLLVETIPACDRYDSPVKERNIALIHFLYSTGCRAVELQRLTVGNVDLGNRSAKVLGKGKKERIVFFDRETAAALREYWRVRGWAGAADPAFARHDKGASKNHMTASTRTIWDIVNEVCDAAGFDRGKFSPHYFRHAYAIRILKQTGNAALVQDLLGHKDANSTRVYAKIYDDDKRDAYRQVFD